MVEDQMVDEIEEGFKNKGLPYRIGGYPFGATKQKTFFDWCRAKGMEIKDIEKFKPNDKLKIILRWKWFCDDDFSAKECEKTRQDILETFLKVPPTEEGVVYWYQNALRQESEANKIKAYFGLISQSEYEALEKSGV